MSWLVATNSCFDRHGKLSLFERMAKNAGARSLLLKCGDSLQLSDDALNDVNMYVMRCVCEVAGLNKAHTS